MATYNAAAVNDATIAFQKPITLQQGRALRDNPLAIAEHAAGAPRAKQKIAGGNATGTGSVTFTGLDDYSGVDMLINLSGSSGGSVTFTLTLEFSNDGTTWLAGSTIFTQTGLTADRTALRVWVDFASATFYRMDGITYSTAAATNASTSAVSMRVRSSSASLSFGVSAEFNGGIA